jgi:hypothetical protein
MSMQEKASALHASPAWPKPATPGPEMEALMRFHRDVRWTGRVRAAADVPEMAASGQGHFRITSNGLWIIGEFAQDQFHEGFKVTEWSAHYIAGWDTARRCYVAFAADSNGRSVPFTGAIEGDRFIITSEGAYIDNAPARLRMIWDAGSPAFMSWRNEMSVAGGPWVLIEEYEMQPMDAPVE